MGTNYNAPEIVDLKGKIIGIKEVRKKNDTNTYSNLVIIDLKSNDGNVETILFGKNHITAFQISHLFILGNFVVLIAEKRIGKQDSDLIPTEYIDKDGNICEHKKTWLTGQNIYRMVSILFFQEINKKNISFEEICRLILNSKNKRDIFMSDVKWHFQFRVKKLESNIDRIVENFKREEKYSELHQIKDEINFVTYNNYNNINLKLENLEIEIQHLGYGKILLYTKKSDEKTKFFNRYNDIIKDANIKNINLTASRISEIEGELRNTEIIEEDKVRLLELLRISFVSAAIKPLDEINLDIKNIEMFASGFSKKEKIELLEEISLQEIKSLEQEKQELNEISSLIKELIDN